MNFVITPHTKNIIIGRGLGKDDILVCAARVCLQRERELVDLKEELEDKTILIDPDWGKEIEVNGYVHCLRCNYKVLFPDHVGEFDVNDEASAYLLCPVCKKKIPFKDEKGKYTVTWTTEVVSKHRRHSHAYYHKECWDNLFIGE
jgi:DNA-directed RNA polymerase subunit RPC12/RpoP